jgi:serine/threonine protein kinase/tetratricopeptide (TPR) repeat protein
MVMTEDTLFAAALARTDPAERAAFLDQACAGDAALRARLEARCRLHEGTGVFAAWPETETDITKAHTPTPGTDREPERGPSVGAAGTWIGRYRLVRKLGEGGMGEVYLAEQEQPVRRRVALKIIKAGLASAPVIARFEQERQALALMEHPNIAKVLDAGTISDFRLQHADLKSEISDLGSAIGTGRPYFVMELVEGIPITRFCDREHLEPRARLQLFISVCQAVQHAHHKGIIHRDLKPSNVLVALYDGKPVPKVIDFGVAKAIGPRLREETLVTEVGHVVGTLEYMSPEQAELSCVDIDTRSDVYSLGVLLYELLTGTTPLTRQRLKQTPFTEVLRIIREDEPDRPSARLSQAGATLTAIAARRRTEPHRLRKLVCGDLDWVVMKALAKERDRRYETAAALALDIARYLADEPVSAGPPSVGYRLRKLIQRNRGRVVAAGFLAAALLAGIVGTTLGMIRAWGAEGDARAALDKLSGEQKKTESALAAETRARARTYQALSAMTDDVIEKLFAQQPALGATEKAFLRKVLTYYEEHAREQGDTERARALAAEGQLRVAKLRAFLGDRRQAEAGYRLAIDQCAQLAGETPAVSTYRQNLATSLNNLGVLLVDLGKHAEAETCYRRALALRQKLSEESPTSSEYRRQVAASHNNLGVVLRELKRPADAEKAYRRSLELRKKLAAEAPTVPEHQQELGGSYLNLGILLRELKKPADAETALQKALALFRALAAQRPGVAAYRRDLAMTYTSLGILLYSRKRPQAEEAFRNALPLRVQLAADFPAVPEYQIDLAGSYANLAVLARAKGKPDEALDWTARAIALLEGMLRSERRLVTARLYLRNAYVNRAEALESLNRHADAAGAWERALPLAEGTMHSRVRGCLACALSRSGNHARACAVADELAREVILDSTTLYNLACVLAKGAAAQNDVAVRDSTAARAVALLARANAAGMFKDATAVADLKKDDDLAGLHSRDDFRKLLKELEAGR